MTANEIEDPFGSAPSKPSPTPTQAAAPNDTTTDTRELLAGADDEGDEDEQEDEDDGVDGEDSDDWLKPSTIDHSLETLFRARPIHDGSQVLRHDGYDVRKFFEALEDAPALATFVVEAAARLITARALVADIFFRFSAPTLCSNPSHRSRRPTAFTYESSSNS